MNPLARRQGDAGRETSDSRISSDLVNNYSLIQGWHAFLQNGVGAIEKERPPASFFRQCFEIFLKMAFTYCRNEL